MAYAAESVASGFQNYYRVGRGRERTDVDNPEHYCSAVAAGYFTVQNNNILQNTRLQLTFNYSSDIVSGTPDHNCKANTPRNPITIYFWASNSSSSKPTSSNPQQYANPITLTGPDRNENKSIPFTREITTTRTINQNEVLWVIFFSDNWGTLIYVDLATLSLTNPNASQSSTIITSPIGLYVRSNNEWTLAADGTFGGASSSLPIYYNSIAQGFDSSGNWVQNTSTNIVSSAKIVYGTAKIINGGIDCYFGITFTNLPMVFCQIYAGANTAAQNAEDYVVQVRSVTETRFCADIKGTTYSSTNPIQICWMAIGV